jgi:hypothetical protein
MIDKNLGIVAIATLVAGAGFLLKGEKTSIKSAEGKEFMAQSGRAIDKRKLQFIIDTKDYTHQRYNDDFAQPIREEMIKKLSRRGLIPNFVASPDYPSYKEWLMKNLEKGSRQLEIPQLNTYKNGYQIPMYDRQARLPSQYDSNGNQIPYPDAQVQIGNIIKPNARFIYESWKYPTLNWKFVAKQRAQYPIDMAAGVYGKNYQTSIQNQPLNPDMKGTPFAYLEWGLSMALKHWMELNPQVKYITYNNSRHARKDIRYLKDLPPSFTNGWPVYGGTQIPYTEISDAKKGRFYVRLPDKSVVDKQANEAFEYFVILWKEYLNAVMIERYSQEIMADYQKGIQEKAMWANLKSSGKLKEYLMEQFDNKRGRMLNPPPAYIPETKAVWEEWKEAQLKGVIDRHNASMSNFEHFMSWF